MLQGWRRLLFFSKNDGNKFSTENPEKDLMDLLIKKTISAGHMLSFEEASEDPEMVQPNNYAYYFGSFGEAAKIAWRRARPLNEKSGGLTEQGRKLVETLQKTRQITGTPYRREVSWMSELQKKTPRGKNSRYTVEEIKEALKEFYNRNGRLPSSKDAKRYDSGLPSWPTLIKILGPKSGWSAIVGDTAAISSDTTNVVESVPISQETILEKNPSEKTVVEEDMSEKTDVKEVAGTTTITEEEKEEPVVSQCNDDNIKIETTHQEKNDFATIDIKITLPDREKPIFITLAV